MNVVGLVGNRRAGKTTVFNMIRELTDANEIMLAAKLKSVLCDVLNLDEWIFADPVLKEAEFVQPYQLNDNDIEYILRKFGIYDLDTMHIARVRHYAAQLTSPRQAAQYVGTDMLRALQPDIHVSHALKSARSDVLNVVTDIRFPDEYDACKSLFSGFKLIYIQRPEIEAEINADTHVSEQYVKKLARYADITICNDSTLDDLCSKVQDLITNVFAPIQQRHVSE